ncbi:MAG: hypothetical protein JSW20_13225 [Nitrospiraceae bacterium]|nr:MAG: hypothetical protein JSW20_13225 [Nitrospiraceae bacterium]
MMYFYLGHELSHLLMHQNTGGYAYIKIPSWFHEGLASIVSNGGGAQNITSREAQHTILSGSNFLPLDSAGITDVFLPRYGSYWKLDNQMFYRQAMLFVGYLKYRNMDSFRAFLTDIQNGNNFAESFNKLLG